MQPVGLANTLQMATPAHQSANPGAATRKSHSSEGHCYR